MLSKKDKQILKFIEEYKSITIKQCEKAIFTNNHYAYDQARKQLRQLYKEKYIQRFQGNKIGEVVYYINERLGIHDLKIIDVISELIYLGCKIKYSKKEYKIAINQNIKNSKINNSNKNYRKADLFIELDYKDYFIPLLIEVDYTHYTSMNKIQEIYKSNHFQDKYKQLGDNIFPLIVIIRPVTKSQLIIEMVFKYYIVILNYQI